MTSLVCTIGRRVRLVVGQDGDAFEDASSGGVVRRLDFNAGDRGFAALQFAHDLDDEALSPQWQPLELTEFIAACLLDARSRSTFLARIVQLLVPTFALRRDPEFQRQIAAIAKLDGLASGGLRVHRIKGSETAICETPRRLRITDDALVICLSDQVSTGLVRMVVDGSDPRRDEKLAVMDCGASSLSGTALLVLPESLAYVELEVSESDDADEFVRRYCDRSPDIVNLAELFDDELGAEIAAAAAQLPRNSVLHVPGFGFHLTLTDAVVMDHGTLISGRIADPEGMLKTLTVVDHGLERQEPLDEAALAEIDVDTELGSIALQFTSFLVRQDEAKAPNSLTFRVELTNGQSRRLFIPACRTGRLQSRRDLLACLSRAGLDAADITRIFTPAIEPVHAALLARQEVRETVDFGVDSTREISIVVPLFRETGFVRSQLMAFAADAPLRASCQIVYVVDDPTITASIRRYLGQAAPVFGLDIRLVTLAHNGGYAMACNIGAEAADGELLVLMNSDVVPIDAGWLEILQSRHAALPRFSAVGPKLLYADGSLQHAGMYFERSQDEAWQNNHYFKGYGASLAEANVERDVPALTGALLALDRTDYLDMGGLDTDYVVGDFEDSDLCLRLRQRGGRCRYVPAAALTHFERQSIGSEKVGWMTGATLYNQALHEDRWAEIIEAMEQPVNVPGRDAA